MKILMGSILNMDADMNGVVITAKEQQALLNRENHTVDLITPYTYPRNTVLFTLLRWTSAAFTRTGFSVFTLLNLAIKGFILAHQTYKLRRNYEVFHAHDLISAMVFLLLARGSDITLLNAHFYIEPWDEFVAGGYIKLDDMSYTILKFLFLRTLNSVNLRLMPVSRRNSGLLNEMVSHKQTSSVVLYPGIDSVTQVGQGLMDQPYLINVGRLDSRKNQVWLIDLLAELEKLGLFCPLVLVGPEDALEKIKVLDRISELKIKSPIHFLGQKNSLETRTLLKSALLYIHAANKESFGRTLVEAMSSKTTVVACEYKAVHEILDDAAILKSHWTLSQTAAYIKTLIEDESLRRNLQESQYKKYLQTFTGQQMISTYSNTLEGQWRLSK